MPITMRNYVYLFAAAILLGPHGLGLLLTPNVGIEVGARV